MLACSLLVQLPAHAQGLAMALDRSGDVEVLAGGKSSKLNLLDYLPADSELRLPANSAATLVYLGTSQEWQFTGPGRFKLQAGQPSALQGAAPKARGVPAQSTQAMAKLEPVQRERMALGAVVMRASGPLRIVSPNNVDVLDPRPTLLWLVTEGRAVRITVTPADSQTPAAQTVTAAMQWTVPVELAPGNYSWRLEAAGEAGGAPAATRTGRFSIIDKGDARRARMAEAPANFAQRVSQAVTLESDNLPHDALLLWRALAAERPNEESLKQWAK
ncbi:MAG: hypothetical protein V4614_00690 [Pseudomonadota bacterium]